MPKPDRRPSAFLRPLTLLALGGLLATGRPLRASEDICYGGQVSLALPEGDLNDGSFLPARAGLAGGLHALIDLNNGHAFRPRVDITAFRNLPVHILAGDRSVLLYDEQAKAQLFSGGLDYNYFVSGHSLEGLYILLGLGYGSLRLSNQVPTGSSAAVNPGVPWPAQQNSTSITYAFGLGWRLSSHLGSEFRFAQGNFRNFGIGSTIVEAPVITLGLTMDY